MISLLKIYRLTALLLLLLMAGIQLMQSLHVHHWEATTAFAKKEPGKPSISKYVAKCPVCTYQHHSHYSGFIPGSFPLTFFASKPVTLSVNYTNTLFEACVLNWTNKGPPATV